MVKHTQTICRQLAAHETAMRKKYPYSEFFWSLISRTGTTEYGDLVNLLQSKCVVYVSEKGGRIRIQTPFTQLRIKQYLGTPVFKYETLCAIWYQFYNLKDMKNTFGGILFLAGQSLQLY